MLYLYNVCMAFKKRKKNKHISQKKHALRRCAERLGINLTDKAYNELVDDISNNRAVFHSKQSNRVSRFKVTIDGTEVIAVYDKHRKTIVTFLHENPDPFLQKIFGWTKR